MNVFLILIFAIHSLFAAEVSVDACSNKARENPITKAFENCEKARAVSSADEFREYISKLDHTGYCALLTEPGMKKPDALEQLCADPNGFVCAHKQGLLLNSQCQFVHLEPEEINQTTEFLDIGCSFKKATQDFIGSHQNECEKGLTKEECESVLKIKYTQEINEIEIKIAYTPERIGRIKNAFNRVKQKYIQKIKASQLISKEQLPMILSRIENTQIDLPPKNTECANTPPTGPESGLYYHTGDHNVHICIGAMATLDHQNEIDLIHSFGHELSHAIDPCTLAQAFPSNPEIGTIAYGNLVQCLRGGKGDDGCTDSIIFCNTDKGVQEACEESASYRDDLKKPDSLDYQNFVKNCVQSKKQLNACPIAKSDLNLPTLNLASYRKTGEKISQLREVFSDYLGSEVAGDLISEDVKAGKLSRADRVDGMTALATDYAGLHGRCVTENTRDSHPAPFLRLNRIIMGSENFRQSIGCENGPPKTPGANMKCQGL